MHTPENKALEQKVPSDGDRKVTPTPARAIASSGDAAGTTSLPAPKELGFNGENPGVPVEPLNAEAVSPGQVSCGSSAITPTQQEGTPRVTLDLEEDEEETGGDLESSKIPSVLDKSAERPVAGKVRLSVSAINGRLRRVMAPNMNGDYKVSEQMRKDFSAKGTPARKQIELIFQMCGYSPDARSETLLFCLLAFYPDLRRPSCRSAS